MTHVEQGPSPARIAVVGATGHTGRFVVRELLRRGLSPVAIARNVQRAREVFDDGAVQCRGAQLENANALDQALQGVSAVINCAGPFLDTASAVVRAALRTKVHYLDVTAEQPSAAATLQSFDEAAKNASVAVLPAVGFYGGFADLLASVAAKGWDDVETIEVVIGLDSWHPTLGTRITGERNTSQRMVIEGGRLVPLRTPPARKPFDFDNPVGSQEVVEIPFSEAVLIHHHLKPSSLHTYLSENALRDVRDPETPPPLPDQSGLSPQRFEVQVTATNGAQRRRVIAKGRDIYVFTAPLICEVAERLTREPAAFAGATTPGTIFDAEGVLAALTPKYITLETLDH